MTLPAETKFPCSIRPEDFAVFSFESLSLGVCVEIPCGDAVCIDREQVESLRDQLTQWLEVTPCGS